MWSTSIQGWHFVRTIHLNLYTRILFFRLNSSTYHPSKHQSSMLYLSAIHDAPIILYPSTAQNWNHQQRISDRIYILTSLNFVEIRRHWITDGILNMSWTCKLFTQKISSKCVHTHYPHIHVYANLSIQTYPQKCVHGRTRSSIIDFVLKLCYHVLLSIQCVVSRTKTLSDNLRKPMCVCAYLHPSTSIHPDVHVHVMIFM